MKLDQFWDGRVAAAVGSADDRAAVSPLRLSLALSASSSLLRGLTFLFLRGPAAWQRRYYQLEHGSEIAESAARHRVNPYLVAAVIDAESDWEADALFRGRARGLMQVLPSTAEELAERGSVDCERVPADAAVRPGGQHRVRYGLPALSGRAVPRGGDGARCVQRGAGERRRVGGREGGDIRDAIEFPETRHYVLQVVAGQGPL